MRAGAKKGNKRESFPTEEGRGIPTGVHHTYRVSTGKILCAGGGKSAQKKESRGERFSVLRGERESPGQSGKNSKRPESKKKAAIRRKKKGFTKEKGGNAVGNFDYVQRGCLTHGEAKGGESKGRLFKCGK